jgi:hypothetical protein
LTGLAFDLLAHAQGEKKVDEVVAQGFSGISLRSPRVVLRDGLVAFRQVVPAFDDSILH